MTVAHDPVAHDPFATARLNMVENQLRPNRIADPRILAAMGAVPREPFVPEALRGVAYADEDIPLGGGRFLVEPLALAKLVEAAAVRRQDSALVIGDPTGYAAAVVARLAARVFLLVPPDERAGAGAAAGPGPGGGDGVAVRRGEAAEGLPGEAPFDVILLVGSVERAAVPERLLAQLADGGRLAVVIEERRFGKVTVHHRVGAAFGRTTPFDAAMPRLRGLEPTPAFEF